MTTLDTLNALAAAIIAPTTTGTQRTTAQTLLTSIRTAVVGHELPLSLYVMQAPPMYPPGTPASAADLSAAAISAGATLTPAVTFPGAASDWPNACGQAKRVLDAIQTQYGLSPPGGLSSFLTLAGLLPGASLPTPGTDPFNVTLLGTAPGSSTSSRSPPGSASSPTPRPPMRRDSTTRSRTPRRSSRASKEKDEQPWKLLFKSRSTGPKFRSKTWT
jgi:hypothetical protein